MGYAIEVDDARRRVTVALRDEITLLDLLGYVDHLVTQGYWTWATIVDTTPAIGLDVDAEGALAFARHVAGYPGRGPVVMVAATRAAKHLGASLMGASRTAVLGHVERRRIVESLEAAHEWLDHQAPAPPPDGDEREGR